MAQNAKPTDVLDGIEGVYDDLSKALKGRRPFVCVIDTQHPDTIRQKMKEPRGYWYISHLRKIVKELSGLPCAAVHYTQIKKADLTGKGVHALIITARSGALDKAYDEELFALIRETDIPTIGFCGGCQLIAQAYGARVDLMRELKAGEADPHPAYTPGRFKEWGFTKVKVTAADPIFKGLGKEIVVNEMHAWEIKELPTEFDVLASTDECKIQVIRHKEKVLYGTQFHAEHYDAEHPDGEVLLGNFFTIAKKTKRKR
ncbi:MAG: gamma-glutamyl-gamma-aminobutyrate hydrolase family protein [Planctomycetota bacterium]